MPVMDGLTATKRLRELGYDMPIIALTGNVMKGDQKTCFAAGFTGFLTKPIRMNLLLAAVSAALTGSTHCVEPMRPPRPDRSPEDHPATFVTIGTNCMNGSRCMSRCKL